MEDLRYPIGRFAFEAIAEEKKAEQRASWIAEIEAAPSQLRTAVSDLSKNHLEMPYREGGWTLRQVVHHIVDSHMNSYVRFRWTLTEDKPVIKAYNESLWAELPDAQRAPIDLSLILLEALHARWVYLLKELNETDYQKVFIHPASAKEISLERNLALYAWHGKHHIAHITSLKEREGWT